MNGAEQVGLWGSFNTADWIILGVVGVSALVSLMRGFVKEAFSLASWVAALMVAMVFHPNLAQLLVEQIVSPSIRVVAAFAALFMGTLIVGGLLGALLSQLFKATGLGGLDRLLGTVFGVARGLLLIMAMLILVPPVIPVKQEVWWQKSALIPHLMLMENWCRRMASSVWEMLPPVQNTQPPLPSGSIKSASEG